MNYNYYSILITILLTIFISGCSKNKAKLLSDEKFASVLSDLMIVEKLNVDETEKILLANKVFVDHNVDSVLFNTTRRHHQNDEQYWISIYGKVEKIVKTKLDTLQKIENNTDLKKSGK